MKTIGGMIVALSLATVIGLGVYGKVEKIQFQRSCEGYLKRAADANTIDLARTELATALQYLESAELTSGSTHAFYSTPECDLDFWYRNLKAAHQELESFPSDADSLSVSNQLIKLRETIVDQGEKGPKVTRPTNIYVYPNQLAYRAALGISLLGLAFGSILMASGSSSCCAAK